MKLKLLSILIILVLLPTVLSLQTIMSPSEIELCGDLAQYVTLNANLTNNNSTLNNLKAELKFDSEPGLSFITSKIINLGNAAESEFKEFSWTLQCNSQDSGEYKAYILYTADGFNENTFGDAESIIRITGIEPLISNASLIEDLLNDNTTEIKIADNTPTISIDTSRNAVCKGSLNNDEPYETMDFMFFGLEKKHNYTFINPVSEGTHNVYVRCKENSGITMQVSKLLSFTIDTLAPVITIISPENKVVGEFTDLSIKTNEESTCKFRNEELNDFTTTSSNTFNEKLSGLDEGAYSYIVECIDEIGNFANKKVEFTVTLPPTAKIIIDEPSPLSKGTYSLTLFVSKPLKETPELSYTFTDDTNFNRPVSLIKEGSSYKGYMIIDNEAKTRAGEFIFEGKDLDANIGTEITEGSIFLVDTQKPTAPATFSVDATADGIVLKWFYDGEKSARYNIYRSLEDGTSEIHFFNSTLKSEYLDKDVSEGALYYYRIAAVDMAGNIGILSKQVSAYAKSGTKTVEDVNTNPPTKETIAWLSDVKKSVDSITIDLDWAENNLKEIEQKESALTELSLVKIVQDAKKETSKLKDTLDAIKIDDSDDSNLRKTLSDAEKSISRIRKDTPNDFSVEKKSETLLAITDADVELAVDELLKKANYTENEIASYKKKMIKVNRNVKAEADIKTISITYLNERNEKKVLVKKRIWHESPDDLEYVIAVEIIPKTVAGDISDIDLRTPDYNVLNPDPVISWYYNKLSFEKQEFSYILTSNDDSEAAKTAKTVALLDPAGQIVKSGNIMTGFSIFISQIPGKAGELFGFILGVFVILGLSMYYMVVVNEVDISTYAKNATDVISKIRKSEKELESINKENSININVLDDAAYDFPVNDETLNDIVFENSVSMTSSEQANQEMKNNAKEIAEPSPIIEQPREKPNLNQALNSALNNNFSYLNDEDPILTIPQQYLHTRNGDVIRSINEMSDVLEEMDDFTYFYHAGKNHNDFADWALRVYHNRELAQKIKTAKNRRDLIKILRGMIR